MEGFLDLLAGEPADLVRSDDELCPDPGTLNADGVVDLLLAVLSNPSVEVRSRR